MLSRTSRVEGGNFRNIPQVSKDCNLEKPVSSVIRHNYVLHCVSVYVHVYVMSVTRGTSILFIHLNKKIPKFFLSQQKEHILLYCVIWLHAIVSQFITWCVLFIMNFHKKIYNMFIASLIV